MARAAGVREATVSLGVDELDSGAEPLGRARQPGGGRKRAADLDPGLRPALLALVEPQERGDPMSPLRWTAKSTRNLADELTRQGHKVSADTVGDLLRAGFSLQGNAKTTEGRRHPAPAQGCACAPNSIPAPMIPGPGSATGRWRLAPDQQLCEEVSDGLCGGSSFQLVSATPVIAQSAADR